MVEIFGPECPFKIPHALESGIVVKLHEPLRTTAKTLADALDAYSKEFGVSILPYDGSLPEIPFVAEESPRYFFHRKTHGECFLVDIHVERGSEDICPKQDLAFLLRPGDRVRIGPLVC